MYMYFKIVLVVIICVYRYRWHVGCNFTYFFTLWTANEKDKLKIRPEKKSGNFL